MLSYDDPANTKLYNDSSVENRSSKLPIQLLCHVVLRFQKWLYVISVDNARFFCICFVFCTGTWGIAPGDDFSTQNNQL